MWINQHHLNLLRDSLFWWGKWPVIGFDYHQMLDIDCSQKPLERASLRGDLPHLRVQAIKRLRQVIEESDVYCKIVIVSHIEESSRNESTLVTTAKRSLLPVDLSIVARKRIGELAALRSLTSGKIFFANDNPEELEEFKKAKRIPFQFRKPRQPAVLDWEYVSWSV